MRALLPILLAPVLLAAEPAAVDGLTSHAAPKPLPAGAVTADWPHFLGPRHNATTRESPLLAKFPADGLPLVWELAAGEGYTCPVFADGRLVYFHRVAGEEVIECLEPETGRRFWSHRYPVAYRDRYGFSPGPRASPVIHDGRVYTAGVTAIHTCLDLRTGERIWQRDLMKDFGIPQYFFGFGPTPFVWKDRLIVNAGGKGPDDTAGTAVVALDKLTGKTLWEYKDTWGASYASPLVTNLRGREVALVLAEREDPVAGLQEAAAEQPVHAAVVAPLHVIFPGAPAGGGVGALELGVGRVASGKSVEV
ncbi:MAG: PQQ-like beta-propeller repeat protein, partial [Akkermansiaceae bacterium]|nr:PQQ-like beta-propeller repeat protein [Akkermansiaceae bacterium]